jgi:hypothetical protein
MGEAVRSNPFNFGITSRWALVLLLAAPLFGCRLARTDGTERSASNERRPSRGSKTPILVLLPRAAAADLVLEGLNQELERDFDLIPRYVEKDTTPSGLDSIIRETKPVAVVLMNNPTVRLYRRYQALKKGSQFPPAVAVLTSFVDRTSVGITNLTAVAYEVPLVTSLVNLRALVNDPIRRVGVIYRPEFENFIAEQRELALVEQFELVGIPIKSEGPSEVQRALAQLSDKSAVDAIWVLNDNRLLDQRTLRDGWLPELRRSWTPVIVNVGSLLSADFDFGTFAVLPDHRAIGLQAANIILDLAARDWKSDGRRVELPVSVETVLAVDIARKRLKLNESELARVGRIVE